MINLCIKNKHKDARTNDNESTNRLLRINCLFHKSFKVRGPFVQTLCIEKDSYMDVI